MRTPAHGEIDTIIGSIRLQGYGVEPKFCARFHSHLDDVLVKSFPANHVGAKGSFRSYGHQGSTGSMDQGTVHFFQDRVMTSYDVHCGWGDQASTLEGTTDFLMFLKHQDLESVLAEKRRCTTANWTGADNDNVVVPVTHDFACGRHGFNLPLRQRCLRTVLRTCSRPTDFSSGTARR